MGLSRMSRFRKAALLLAMVVVSRTEAADAGKGRDLFKQCAACHAVGANARHKIGPELNDVIGRTAGSAPGYSYSPAMMAKGQEGLVWSEKTLDRYLMSPRTYVKGTKMPYAGPKKDAERADLIAYLATFSQSAKKQAPAAMQTAANEPPERSPKMDKQPAPRARPLAATTEIPKHGTFHLGRRATLDEIRAWDIDIRPDGAGLPAGKGSVAEGEKLFTERCAGCHGDFGEGRDRWPALAGGMGTLTADRPVKTVGSYWPYLSTVYDYIRRAQPFGDARSLSDDDVYALTAYVLFLNDLVDGDFALSATNFSSIHLPNEGNFIPDNRVEEPQNTKKVEPCLTNCNPTPAKVIMRAGVLDVTPDSDQGKDHLGRSVE